MDAESQVSFCFPIKRGWLRNLLEGEFFPVEVMENAVKVEMQK